MSDIQPTESEHIEEQTALEAALRKGLAWFSTNLTTVIYALAGLLAIAAVIVFLQRKPAGNPEASKLLLVATSPEEYQDVADSAPTSLLGMWSRLRQGDRLLDNAVTNMFTDRETGMDELESAKAAYENLGNQSGLPDTLRERVLIGMARVAECECDGSAKSIETAETAWQQVLAAFPESIMKEHAEARIARLQKPEAVEFYKWFAALDPKPALPGIGSVPEIPDGLLPNDLPGAALENMEEATAPSADATKPEADAAAETPAEGSLKETEEAAPEGTEKAEAEKVEPAKADPAKAEKPVEAAEEAAPAKKPEEGEATEATTEQAKTEAGSPEKTDEAASESTEKAEAEKSEPAKAEEAAPAKTSEAADPEAAKSEPETAKSDGDN